MNHPKKLKQNCAQNIDDSTIFEPVLETDCFEIIPQTPHVR